MVAAGGAALTAHAGRSNAKAAKTILMRSELEPERGLTGSRVGCRGVLSEAGVRLAAVRGKTCSRIEGRKLRVVQRIVHLPAQLKVHRFAHLDTLEDSQIPVVNSRQPQDVLTRVTQRAYRRESEHTGVERFTE